MKIDNSRIYLVQVREVTLTLNLVVVGLIGHCISQGTRIILAAK